MNEFIAVKINVGEIFFKKEWEGEGGEVREI